MAEIEELLKIAQTCNVVPVVEILPADLLTPLAVYLKLADGGCDSFLLESVEGGENLARYSFIGANPELIATGNGEMTRIIGRGIAKTVDSSLLEHLREHFSGKCTAHVTDLPSFSGGAIGFLGFSFVNGIEPSLRRKTKEKLKNPTEDGVFMFFRSLIAFDHAKQQIKIITLVFTDEADEKTSLENAFKTAMEQNRSLKHALQHYQAAMPPVNNNGGATGKVTSNWNREEFENAVRTIKDLICAGECYQVVLSQCFEKPTDASPVSIYRALRSINPSPYMFLLRIGERSIIGASPEMLVRCREGELDYRPIAGTRPRGTSIEEDEKLAEEMRADPKETAEHRMLVDLGRNDLGRVAAYGSVKVNSLMHVEKYSHVQHLVSSISARLRDGLDRFDALASCFPAGTVSGAPKVRAIEIIRELEPTARGIYSGAVGYFDYSGNMDTCIAIRTIMLEKGVAKVQAGAGIVADSVPGLEYEESVNKAKAMLRAIELAENGEF